MSRPMPMDFIKPLLWSLPWIISIVLTPPYTAAATPTASTQFSYSTNGGEVNGRRILIGPDPGHGRGGGSLQGYTHYLVPSADSLRSTNFSAYAFTIQLAVREGRNDTGICIAVTELRDIKEQRQRQGQKDKQPISRKSAVCTNYQITLSYPEEPNKPSAKLCKWNGEYTDSLLDLLAFRDYGGLNGTGSGGSVHVTVEPMPTYRLLNELIRFRNRDQEVGPWRRIGARAPGTAASIPAEAVAAIGFTVYQDCEVAATTTATTATTRLSVRPCSIHHNSTCIPSALFCDSEPNCGEPLWEFVWKTAARANRMKEKAERNGSETDWDGLSSYMDMELEYGAYDERGILCGHARARGGEHDPYGYGWERTTITKTYTRTRTQTNTNTYSGSSGGGGGGGGGSGRWRLGAGIGLTVILSVLSLGCAVARRAGERGGSGRARMPMPVPMPSHAHENVHLNRVRVVDRAAHARPHEAAILCPP